MPPRRVCSVYELALAIIVQGKKKILLGEETYHYGAAQYLVVSVKLPIRGFIVAATPGGSVIYLQLILVNYVNKNH